MTATTAFASLAASFLGLAVLTTDKTGEVSEFKIARLDTKMGTMKDGSKAEYVVLQRADNENVVISLHPNVAKKLFNKGEADSFKIKPVSAAEVLEAEQQAALQAELGDELAGATGDVEVKADKGPSKKDRAVAIYVEVVNAGGARKDVYARFMKELGMSAPGASTYYQNCKGTKAVKWTA